MNDDMDLTSEVDEEAKDEAEETATEPEETVDEPEEEKEDPLEAIRKDYDAKLEAAQKEINRLGYALRRDKKEPKEEAKPAFTDAQLLAILQEHSGDPTVTLQVMKEIVKTGTKDVEANAEKAADIKQKRNEFERYMETTYPRVLEDGTPEGEAVDKAIDWLHLDGHPFAKYLAIATMQLNQLPQIIEKVKEDTKKELLGKTAETKRKDGIKKTAPANAGTPEKKTTVLTTEQMQTAKRLFGNDKALIARYASMLGKDSSVTARE
jgi:hypothetical protein